jgi:hypothetical protein
MGTWVAIERAESRNYSTTYPGMESSLDVVYLVQWVAASAGDTYPGETGLFGAVPKVRDRLPAGIINGNSYLKTFVCRSVDATVVRDAPYTWNVTCRFTTFQIADGQHVAITRQSSTRQANVYRIGPTIPANGDVVWPAGVVDIGGTKVDAAGNPVTYEIPQMQISMEILWDRTAQNGGTVGEPPTSLFTSYIGTRNSAAFLGCDIGTLVYRGFTVSPNWEYYRIQHQWLWDQNFHLEQIALPMPDGAPVCESIVTIAGVDVLQCSKVGFFQKYPSKTAHASLIAAANLGEITAPKPTAI